MAGVEEHLESADYLRKRQLKSGTAGWVLLAGLGVSYVISGDYSGWNFGLAEGGFGGLAIAAVIIAGMAVLLVTCVTVLILTTGAGGAEAMSGSGNPLVEALGDGTAAKVVNYIGLAGLIASFFSIIYAYSRQLFALSRAGYLPKVLSVTNSRKAPTLALLVPGLVGFLLSLTGQGAMLLNMAVFGAALSYVLMMISHIVPRRREPEMPRPYRTPGGVATTGFALVIGVFAVIATFLVDPVAAGWCLGVFAAFMLYFAVYSRHQLVANSPDEEFAMLARAESELK